MKFWAVLLMTTLSLLPVPYAWSDTCNVDPGPDMGETPLTDFTAGQKYRGLFPGFLYDGINTAPADHDQNGQTLASLIQPLDINGVGSTNGKIVFLSIGFSNNTIEFCGGDEFYDTDGSQDDPKATKCPPPAPLVQCSGDNCPFNFQGGQQSFMEQAFAPNSGANQSGKIVLVDGAKGGEVLPDWDPFSPDNRHCPADCKYNYERIDQILASNPDPNLRFSKLQVQSIWLKDSDSLVYQPRPALCPPFPQPCTSPNPGNDAFAAEIYMGDILRALRLQYPNLKQVFVSSRIYGGYANTSGEPLMPEPYAFEHGLSVKWLIKSQITQHRGNGGDGRAGNLSYSVPPDLINDKAPWVAWGPYLWANGPNHRTYDNFPGWFKRDLRGTAPGRTNECTHPSINGERKVGKLLLDFMKSSAYTLWFKP